MADTGIPTLGTPTTYGRRHWVQTERAAHEAWAQLTMASPRAAALMHHLVSMMGHQNAVVISQKTLAKVMGCEERTIRRALIDLKKGNWIQVVQIGSTGTMNAYVVNAAVAWGEKREHIGRLAVFQAQVVADASEQPGDVDSRPELRRVPIIYPPEQALPVGKGEVGAQIAFPGMEPVVTASVPAKDLSGVLKLAASD